MNHFLAPILRQQFTLFYRFGYTFISDSLLISFEGVITQSVKEEVAQLLKQVTPFEYDEEYVILHLQNENGQFSGNNRFEIYQLTTIYPLSQQAKISISQKTDTRIVLGEPIFEESLAEVEDTILKEEVIKGIDALWDLYEEKETDKKKLLSQIGLDNLLEALKVRSQGIKAINLVGKNYWTYLLAYDRFDYFPKETIGYFFDAGQLFAYSKGKPIFENSNLHGFLTKILSTKPFINFESLVKELTQDPQAAGYIDQTVEEGLRLYVVAPLFLRLKDEIRNSETFSAVRRSKIFTYAKENFNLEFKATLILLGAFFMFKTFYDEYYNELNLDIYQKQLREFGSEKQKISNKPDNLSIDRSESGPAGLVAGTQETLLPTVENLPVQQSTNKTLSSSKKGKRKESTINRSNKATRKPVQVAKPNETLNNHLIKSSSGVQNSRVSQVENNLAPQLSFQLNESPVSENLSTIQVASSNSLKVEENLGEKEERSNQASTKINQKNSLKKEIKVPKVKSGKHKTFRHVSVDGTEAEMVTENNQPILTKEASLPPSSGN